MRLPIYVITARTKDFPGKVVLRRHVFTDEGLVPDREPLAVAATVPELRAHLPPGVCRFPWSADDDPVIVEWWS